MQHDPEEEPIGPSITLNAIRILTDQIAPLVKRSRDPAQPWGYGYAATLKNLQDRRSALQRSLPELRVL